MAAEPPPPPIRETVPEPAPASVVQPELSRPAPQAPSRRGGERLHSRCSIRLNRGSGGRSETRGASRGGPDRATRRGAPATGCRGAAARTAEPGQHKMSLPMVVAALLLVISAALLFTRLKSKPDLDAPPPAMKASIPAPAAEAPRFTCRTSSMSRPTLMAARCKRCRKRRRSRLTPSSLPRAAWATRHRFASARIPSMPRSFRHRSAPPAACSLPASA